MSCPLIPAPNRVILKQCKAEKVSPGGIALPDSADQQPIYEIVAGEGECPFYIGDKVLISEWIRSYETDGDFYVICKPKHIQAVLR
jgi:co-chaperonin GroES (HSP10)